MNVLKKFREKRINSNLLSSIILLSEIRHWDWVDRLSSKCFLKRLRVVYTFFGHRTIILRSLFSLPYFDPHHIVCVAYRVTRFIL